MYCKLIDGFIVLGIATTSQTFVVSARPEKESNYSTTEVTGFKVFQNVAAALKPELQQVNQDNAVSLKDKNKSQFKKPLVQVNQVHAVALKDKNDNHVKKQAKKDSHVKKHYSGMHARSWLAMYKNH